MKYKYLGLLFLICLSACSHYENYLSDQVEKTVSAIPTATPYPTATSYPTYTPIPLPTATATLEPLTTENFDISELFVEDDLPRGQFYDGDLVFSLPSDFEDLPEPDIVASQYIRNFSDSSGLAVVVIYNDPEKLQSAMDATVDDMGEGKTEMLGDSGYNFETYQIVGVGDEAYVSSSYIHFPGDYIFMEEVSFKRCNAYVHVILFGITDSQTIIDYAKKFDERIQSSSACGIKN